MIQVGDVNQSGVGVGRPWLCELWAARVSLWVPASGDPEAMPAPYLGHLPLHLTAPDQAAMFPCIHPVESQACVWNSKHHVLGYFLTFLNYALTMEKSKVSHDDRKTKEVGGGRAEWSRPAMAFIFPGDKETSGGGQSFPASRC